MFDDFTGYMVTNDEENAGYVLLEIIRGMVVDVTCIVAKNEEEALKKAVEILGVDVGIEFMEDIDYYDEEDYDYEEEDDDDEYDEDDEEEDSLAGYDPEDIESITEYYMDPSHSKD